MRSAFHREQPASVNILEVAEWKFVSSFDVFGMCFVDSEMPLCIFNEPARPNKLILLFRARTVVAPIVLFIKDDVSLRDQFFGISERVFV